jgi:hypothetical protein
VQVVTVPAIKAFIHEGRQVTPGDGVRVTPVTAAVLARKGLVSLTKAYKPTYGYLTRDVVLAEDETPSEEGPKAKRAYRRRDMTAETT